MRGELPALLGPRSSRSAIKTLLVSWREETRPKQPHTAENPQSGLRDGKELLHRISPPKNKK